MVATHIAARGGEGKDVGEGTDCEDGACECRVGGVGRLDADAGHKLATGHLEMETGAGNSSLRK